MHLFHVDLIAFGCSISRPDISQSNCLQVIGCTSFYQNIKEREKEVFQKEEFDKLGKIDYHRKKADENITRRLIKTTLGKWKDEYKAQTI